MTTTADDARLGSFDERALYRGLFAAYPDALLLADRGGCIVLANPAAEQLLGYAPGELNGLAVEVLVPDAIRPRHAAYRDAYNRTPRARPMGTQMELVAKRRDGSEVMVEIALSPLQVDGEPLVVAAVRGIEAYPRVRQALQRARYSEFVAQMGRIAVDSRDPQQLLQQVPAVAADALQSDIAIVFLLEPSRLEFSVGGGVGLLPGEEVGHCTPNRPDTPPGFVLAQGRAVTVVDYRSEQRFAIPPAYLAHGLVSGLAVPLMDRGQIVGTLAVRSREAGRFGPDELHFLESLSNLLAASLQRVRSEEALSHAQRLETVGQLTGGIAHDFNNLLTVIQGNLQVLEDHPAVAGDPSAQPLVAAAARASRRGAELTGKLLTFSRRQLLSPKAVDVGEMLTALTEMLRRTVDQRIHIEVDTPADASLHCVADAGQLESALLNIAINARDAMPDGGRLSFAARHCRALPAELVGEPAAGPGARHGYVEIDIVDTGQGMTDAVRERAFEPFFTTKELGRGTGLGLSTVYGFVKQSHGAVQLHTGPGAGTRVTLYLPSAQVVDTVADARPGEAGVPADLDVVLVEDEPEVRTVIARFLRALRCRVREYDSAEAALAALGDTAPTLLLTDIALGPGLRGPELARRVQQHQSDTAVLLMSGYSTELLREEGGEALPWELLRKPFERGALEQAILRALAARRPRRASSS